MKEAVMDVEERGARLERMIEHTDWRKKDVKIESK